MKSTSTTKKWRLRRQKIKRQTLFRQKKTFSSAEPNRNSFVSGADVTAM